MDGFCRGCLIKYDEPTDLLHYTEKNRRLFVYSTGLQVKRNDTFTFQLCKDCYINMKTSARFKKQCRNSEKRFQNYLALKHDGNNIDFCTFLKNDDSWSLRLQMPSGNSTPVHQKMKDDDNDSTCTSIRNFMTDILKSEDLPDTEARIIREVIEEEADVLDDSLDSHWLQDDVSIDTDFRLDFSFSPFSTPKSVANDHCYTPRKDDIHFLEPSIIPKRKHVYVPTKATSIDLLSDNNVPNNHCENQCDNNEYFNGINLNNNDQMHVYKVNEKHENNGNHEEIYNIITDVVDNDFMYKVQDYTIDRNIENALADTSNKEITLDDLLKTPPVHLAPSPSITNILFGDKLDGLSTPNTGQWIENYENVQSDMNILEEFLHGDDKDEINEQVSDQANYKIHENEYLETDMLTEELKEEPDDVVNENQDVETNNVDLYFEDEGKNVTNNKRVPLSAIAEYCDIENNYCKLCKKKLNHLTGVKLHFAKIHNILLVRSMFKKRVCDYCGQELYVNSINFQKHRRNHFDKLIVECEICNKKYCGLVRLEKHKKRVHGPKVDESLKKTPKFVCPICGKQFNAKSAYIIHQERHYGITKYSCVVCNKQFHSRADMNKHLMVHSGVRGFACSMCPKRFARRDALTRHLNTHKDEKYECDKCNRKFRDKNHLRKHVNKTCPILKRMNVETEKKTKRSRKRKVYDVQTIKIKVA